MRGTTRHVLAGVAVCVTLCADAAAAPAQQLTLRYAGGPGACIVAVATLGCEPLRGVRQIMSDRNGLRAMAMSPDGRNVYLAFQGPRRPREDRAEWPTRNSAIVVLRRRPDTGALSQLAGREGCLSLVARRGCTRARAIDDPWGLAMSPDGRFVYATAVGRAAAAVFARDRNSGALRQLPGRRGCIRPLPKRTETCTYARLGGVPDAAYLSPDGAFLYAFERPLRRDAKTGMLTPAAERPCPKKQLCNLGSLALAPNSRDVYVLGDRYGIYGRRIDPRSGALRRMPGAPACWAFPARGCGQVLGEFARIGAPPDGRHLYVTLGVDDVIVRFARDRRSGLLAEGIAEPVCGGRSSTPPCPVVGGLEHLVFAPDARRAYAILGGFPGSTVMANQRDLRTGRLTPALLPAGCVTLGDQSESCGLAPPVPGSHWDSVVSPDGRFLYVLSAGGVVALSTE